MRNIALRFLAYIIVLSFVLTGNGAGVAYAIPLGSLKPALLDLYSGWSITTQEGFEEGLLVGTEALGNMRIELATSASWYNSAWRYRKPITITNSSGAPLTNYQGKVTLDTQT